MITVNHSECRWGEVVNNQQIARFRDSNRVRRRTRTDAAVVEGEVSARWRDSLQKCLCGNSGHLRWWCANQGTAIGVIVMHRECGREWRTETIQSSRWQMHIFAWITIKHGAPTTTVSKFSSWNLDKIWHNFERYQHSLQDQDAPKVVQVHLKGNADVVLVSNILHSSYRWRM